MGNEKILKFHFTNKIFYFTLKVVNIIIILAITNISFSNEIKTFFKTLKGCLKVYFSEEVVFDGEYQTYKGLMIKGENQIRIFYQTQPPFKVVVSGDTVKIGYEGEESEIFNRKEYKNPILEILFHLENPEKIFEFKPLGKDVFLLIPKGDLANYILRGKLFLRNGKPYIIEVESGEDNHVTILLEKIVPQCE